MTAGGMRATTCVSMMWCAVDDINEIGALAIGALLFFVRGLTFRDNLKIESVRFQ